MLSEKCIMHTASIDIYGLMMRGYYFTSMCIIVISIFIFLWSFEKRKPKNQRNSDTGSYDGISCGGKAGVFYDTSGKALCSHYYNNGGHVRKAVRILMWSPYGFCIRIFLWAGPWTPWQMIAFGIIGFLSGVLFSKKNIKYAYNKWIISIYGFLATFVIYGFYTGYSHGFYVY